MTELSRLDDFEVHKILGMGATAKVKLCRNVKTNQFAAVKIIKFASPAHRIRVEQFVRQEISALQKIHSSHIVSLLASSEESVYVKKNGGGSYICMYLAMELCEMGELFNVIDKSGRFEDRISRALFKQIIQALEECHTQGIAHRDLKPENILFDSEYNIKLTDFGFAIPLQGRDGSGQLHTKIGTYDYMAPEVFANQPYSGQAADLFAAGVVLFILYTGSPPFARAVESDSYFRLLKMKHPRFWQLHSRNRPPNFFSNSFKDLIHSMLDFDPQNRLNIDQIKNHAWFTQETATKQEVFEEISGRCEKFGIKAKINLTKLYAIQTQGPRISQSNPQVHKAESNGDQIQEQLLSNPFQPQPTDQGLFKYNPFLQGLTLQCF